MQTGLLELLDGEFNKVPELTSDWIYDERGDAAGCLGRLKPGPYILRTSMRGSPEPEWVDQTIWLSPGWQTIVFVPNTSFGPDSRGLSVHMTDLGSMWHPDDIEAAATEAALAGLRDGTDSIDRFTTEMLLYGKFRNPILGVLGLHTLMMGPSPDPELVQTVVRNLEHLIGDHPDVMALAAALPERDLNGIEVSWPPMLERSYRACLLPANRAHPGVLLADSPAQRIAPLIRIPGPWLRWTAAMDIMRATDRWLHEEVDIADDFEYLTSPEYNAGVPDRPFAPGPARGRLASGAEAAAETVGRAVLEIASFKHYESPREAVRIIGVTELARRTGFPEQLVATSIRRLGLD
ncbi:hypothetical protein OUO20_05545 [Arthrobacter sp. FX8]|uniref:hypothetical protein n=1 Tax=Arthrobacter sp. FX8 TaxID=2997335 RepID=UPI00227BDC42|nr:hypothetical protein [Arthrobacter sp. FX8]WAJ34399.1 hypothetical protein OUO20_05545 [Arthrobacter sp. FX8]